MQRIFALRVAMTDRPKIFQLIVGVLFSLAVLTVIVCVISLLQVQKHRNNYSYEAVGKKAQQHGTYASFSATKP